MARNKNKNKGIKVDLSGVETGRKAVPEGSYHVKLVEATIEESQSTKGAQYIKMVFEVTEGKHKGAKLFHNCSLQPQALFNLKAVLVAIGYEIPGKAFEFDIAEIIDSECDIEVANEIFEGKKKAVIVEFLDPDDSDDDDDSDDVDLESLDKDELVQLAEELKIAKKKIKAAKTEEALIELIEAEDEDKVAEAYEELFGDDEEEEEEDEPDYESMTLAELKEECEERGIKVPKKAKEAALIELLEADDEE